MKYAIHLIDPVADQSGRYKTMRCGLTRNVNTDEFYTTTNPIEATCLKCKIFIRNPYRCLRKYGKVKVCESFFVLVLGDYGNRLDLVAVFNIPGEWEVVLALENKVHSVRIISASNMADLGEKLLKIYESEISSIKKQKL
jgi:hypothetical protein